MLVKQRDAGFTIVELLIVIVVIGILAAITIVAYSGIQNRAYDAAVKSDLANFVNKIELAKVDSGTYPATLTSAMGFGFSKGSYGQDFQGRNVGYCYNSSNDTYILMAVSKSGNYFKVQNTAVSSSIPMYGYDVCSQIGLSSTQPQAGYIATASPQWYAWTN